MSIDRLAGDARALRQISRRLNRTVAQMQGQDLARYELAPGEPLDERELLDFLRLALQSRENGVVITVSQPARAQTKEKHP